MVFKGHFKGLTLGAWDHVPVQVKNVCYEMKIKLNKKHSFSPANL